MNWDDIRIFLAVARAGQILGAARNLGLNHATVARRLSALEEAVGARLLVRRASGSALTAEGEALLRRAEIMESAALAARTVGGQPLAGTVRIGAPDGFGVAFLAPRLGALRARHPDLHIQLVPVPRSFSLSKREADIAITLERPTEGRLVARKLVDYTLGLYGARSYLDRHGAPQTPGDLARHALIGYVEDLIFTASLDFTRELWRDWRSTIEISSAVGQTEAVRAGAGLGILHVYIARRHPELVRLLPELGVVRNYWLVMHEDARAIARIGAVADFIVEEIARDKALFLADR